MSDLTEAELQKADQAITTALEWHHLPDGVMELVEWAHALLTAYRQLQARHIPLADSHQDRTELLNTLTRLLGAEHYGELEGLVRQLQAERDNYKKWWDNENIERGRVEQERDRLCAAVEKYGYHDMLCAIHQRTQEKLEHGEWPACSCGLDAAKGGR